MSLEHLGRIEAPVVAKVADPIDQDEFPSALSVAIVGIGQAGGRIADAAWALGFRRVVAINTSPQDLATLTEIPTSNRFHYGEGGAGKNPEKGRDQFIDARGRILDFMRDRLGQRIELVLIVAGAGGGTGSGALIQDFVAGQVARDFLEGCDSARKSVGVLVTMPDASDGAGNIAVANRVLNDLSAHSSAEIAPLIVVDNGRITRLWPDITVQARWPRANQFIMGAFQAFLSLAKETPTSYTFDAVDLWRVLMSGPVVFGMFDLARVNASDLAEAVRQGVNSNLMSSAFDLSKATDAALLFVGSTEAVGMVRAADMDYATKTLLNLIDRERGTIHRGVYEVPKGLSSLRVYTAIGGMPAPKVPTP